MKFLTHLSVRKVGNDYIMLQPGLEMLDMARVFTLSESAAMIIEEFKGRDFEEQDAVDFVLRNFEVEAQRAKIDVRQILTHFFQEGLFVAR